MEETTTGTMVRRLEDAVCYKKWKMTGFDVCREGGSSEGRIWVDRKAFEQY
jgi:hypothetical protein